MVGHGVEPNEFPTHSIKISSMYRVREHAEHGETAEIREHTVMRLLQFRQERDLVGVAQRSKGAAARCLFRHGIAEHLEVVLHVRLLVFADGGKVSVNKPDDVRLTRAWFVVRGDD